MENCIRVQGARVNNLKNISVEIPRDKLVVLTGLSGSGKSSLAFDTIFAEGQRRYVESLSSYARMFLGQMDKPDVDAIDGLSPAISIDQKTTSRNPRSTVGTVTEIYDYLRLLWARCGTPHCPKCGKEIRRQTIDQIVDQIMGLPERTKFQILSPVVRGKKGEHQKVFDDARRGGYARVRVDGSLYELTEEIPLDKNKKHHIEVVVDRLIMKPDLARRLTDSVETAANLSGGLVILNELGGRQGHPLLPELRLRGLRHLHAGTVPAHVLVQQSLRGLPRLLGSRHTAGGRPPAHHPRPLEVHPAGRHPGLRLEQRARRFHLPDVF